MNVPFCLFFLSAAVVLVVDAACGFGFNDFPSGSFMPPNSGLTHARIWDIGCSWAEIHTAPNTYDWNRLDQVVANHRALGATKIAYAISATPKFLQKYPQLTCGAEWIPVTASNSLPDNKPASLDEFNKFVFTLATRYKGKINQYEIWNEPQGVKFMYPFNDESITTLAAMQKRAFSTIKSVDPSAEVLSGSLMPRDSSGGLTKMPKLIKAYGAVGWPFHSWNIHIYPDIGKATSTAAYWYSMITRTRSQVVAAGGPKLKVHVTESNFNTNKTCMALPCPLLSEASQVDLVLQIKKMMAVDKADLYWYAWDRWHIPHKPGDMGGIVFNSASPAWLVCAKKTLDAADIHTSFGFNTTVLSDAELKVLTERLQIASDKEEALRRMQESKAEPQGADVTRSLDVKAGAPDFCNYGGV